MSNRALPSANASRSVKPGMGGGGVAKKPTPTPTTSSSSSNNKKVDIIHTSDEDTETEEDEPTFIKNEDLNENDKRTLEEKNAPQADELLRTKRPRNMKPFTEDLLTNPHGLSRIYHEFPLNAKFTSRGSEAIYLQRLITMYKGWAFQLHPGVSFQDVLLKCETLGSKSKIRQTLTMMRERERERYIDGVLLPAMDLPARHSSSSTTARSADIASPPSSSYSAATDKPSGSTTISASSSLLTSPSKSVRIQEASHMLSSAERSTRSKASPAANKASSKSARRVLNDDDEDEEFDDKMVYQASSSSGNNKRRLEEDEEEDSIFGNSPKPHNDDKTTQEPMTQSQDLLDDVFSPERLDAVGASPPSLADRALLQFEALDEDFEPETEAQQQVGEAVRAAEEEETATQMQEADDVDDNIATQQQ